MTVKALFQRYTEKQQEQVLPVSVYDFESHLKKIAHIKDKESVYAPITKFNKQNYAESYVGYLSSNKFLLRPTRRNSHENLSVFLCEGSYERYGEEVKLSYTIKPEPQWLRFLTVLLVFWAVITAMISYSILGIVGPIVCLLFLCFFLVFFYAIKIKLAVKEFESDLK
jgi:hypothetical protein